jgi:hypothetical protein
MTTSNLTMWEKLIKGLELYYQRLIKNKCDRNFDMVISDNGKVVHVNPKKFQK